MKQSMTNFSHPEEHLYAKFHQTIKNYKNKLMKKLIFIFVLLCMFSCSDYIDKPKNLVDKDLMAEVLADLTINDQATFMYQDSNLEAGTRFILKSHKVKPNDFVESFKYYVIKDEMQDIANKAQEILLKKDPKADKYIKDKQKNSGIPPIMK
ncbi:MULTISPECIES: DUF4296 domain-containing protein [Chryseobacterium]|jgi:hypothetical protein|uniref:DUF4296 domain-containing protein n=2 Tax=Chryseobacterium TaxID=59732 RepID=A0AAE4C3T5_9FLAO|nr:MULTISPECIES: DUF4296 domain-containing protein [Chryseobacterium]MDC8102177.1 DUF4296 domain-containing protein [Chryseobacterium rhizosphaerae]MDR6526894.1 hypothetical protein [Chryseobacterium rhizosphaerae]MDR6544517.1 hypothetical protein [Chryseobacterium rhizosphaerae]SMC76349.1 protein of unknown function [Chryseobacterium sp. YR221]